MLLLGTPTSDSDRAHEPRPRSAAVVWQPHYEGFTTIAYHGGRAIAGISGPWSDQYVLIWWQPSQPIRELEVFDSLDAAKRAVVRRMTGAGDVRRHLRALLDTVRSAPVRRVPWLARVRQWWRARTRAARGIDRRRVLEETDLRGVHLSATR